MKLSELKPGESAVITKVGGSGSLRQHFLDMGLIPDAKLTLIKLAPMGDPMEFMVHGYELSIRKDDAAEIDCEKAEADKEEIKPFFRDSQDHPGLGEEGKYHEKKGETPRGMMRLLHLPWLETRTVGRLRFSISLQAPTSMLETFLV